MYMTPIVNFSLLRVIERLEETTIEELRKHYLPPKQNNVLTNLEINFDSELKTLAETGCISIEENVVKFIRFI